MLEAKLEFEEAIKKGKPKTEVKELFSDYCEQFNKIKNPSNKSVQSYKNMFNKYLEYVYFKGENNDRK